MSDNVFVYGFDYGNGEKMVYKHFSPYKFNKSSVMAVVAFDGEYDLLSVDPLIPLSEVQESIEKMYMDSYDRKPEGIKFFTYAEALSGVCKSLVEAGLEPVAE